ncbi:MAG: SemiSWEET transporter [Defluviicoccus sp.]
MVLVLLIAPFLINFFWPLYLRSAVAVAAAADMSIMMNIPLTEVIGIIAGLCSTSSFVPQVIKAWREGETEAISGRMYIITVTAFSLWIAYGLMIDSLPIIVFNITSLVLSGTILLMKLRRRDAQASRPNGAEGR